MVKRFKMRSNRRLLWKPNLLSNTTSILASLLVIAALWFDSFGAHTFGFEIEVKIGLTLITGYFIFHTVLSAFERAEVFEKTTSLIEDQTQLIEDLTQSIGVLRIVQHSSDYYRELQGAMDAAQDSIFLFYLTKEIPSELGKASQRYWEWFKDFAQRRGNDVTIKRIASIDSSKKARWVLKHTKEMAEVRGYGIRCFEGSKTLSIPGMEIIDKKETFIFGPHGRTPRWVYIDNEDIGSGMATYFDNVWGEVLKVGGFELKGVGETSLSQEGIRRLTQLAERLEAAGGDRPQFSDDAPAEEFVAVEILEEEEDQIDDPDSN